MGNRFDMLGKDEEKISGFGGEKIQIAEFIQYIDANVSPFGLFVFEAVADYFLHKAVDCNIAIVVDGNLMSMR